MSKEGTQPRFKNIAGLRSGKLVAKEVFQLGGNGVETLWKCDCDCGNSINVKVSRITGGYKKHCGCVRHNEDLAGEVFGRLTAKYVDTSSTNKRVKWVCSCECGKDISVTAYQLKSGKTKSCGCLQQESRKTHGMSGTRPYKIWESMITRLTCESHESFPIYGGRGIKCIDKWKTFEGFWEDMQVGYSDELTLDRIDVDGNYSPENCRWVSPGMQSYNRHTQNNNTSGRCGVSYYSARNNWEAYISFEGVFIKLGYFTNFEDAVKAREEAELKYYGFIKE